MTDVERVKEIVGKLAGVRSAHDHKLMQVLLSYARTDLRWDTRGAVPDGEVYVGHNGLMRFFTEFFEVWESWEWEIEFEPYDTPDGVVVMVRETGTTRNGLTVSQSHVQRWQLENGRLARWTCFTGADEQLEALEAVAA